MTTVSDIFEKDSSIISRDSDQMAEYIVQDGVKHSGIYGLYAEDGAVLYVGMSGDLKARIRSHLKYRQYPSSYFVEHISYIRVLEVGGESVKRSKLRDLEDTIIRRYKPLFNGTSSSSLGVEGVYGYKNLRSQLDVIRQEAIARYRGDAKREFMYARKEVGELLSKESGNKTEVSGGQICPVMYSVRESIKLVINDSELDDVDKIIDGLLMAVKLAE